MASALQAQLAALSGAAGNHPGSSFAPNKRHEEAVGRGVNYNVQQGQIVNYRDFRFRATIIYKNSKEAADTPLATLQENCQDALVALSDILPSLSSTGLVLCGQQEDASNTYIQQVLVRISILLGENDEQVTQNCLHVVEYLLRRYEIHQHLMEDLLWTFMPHHQQLPNIWHRCLLLVDLASHPSYLWLRPYADANRPAPTPRALCARHMSKEIPLLRRVCLLVRQTTRQAATEPDDPSTPLRGWSHILSWTAACLVDGLVQQQQQQGKSSSHDHSEAVARILVPVVRQALRAENEEYCSWGCVVASTMAECLDLSSSAVLAQWGAALLQNGAADPVTAWAALASMLLAGQDPQRVEEESYLPILPLQNEQWMGCPLPSKLFDLVTLDCVGPLASLYQQEVEVTPLVVAMLVRSIRANNVELAIALLEEDQLVNLWKRHNLVASVAAYLVRRVCLEDLVSVDLETGRAILQTLCTCFSTAVCEKGVAQAVGRIDLATLQPLIEGLVAVVSSSSAVERTDILPPRIALEHPEVQVRRSALEQLVKDNNSFQGANNMDDGETLVETLLRRCSVEPNHDLAEAMARAVVDADAPLITTGRAKELCQGILSTAHHWIDTNDENITNTLSRIVEKAVLEAHEMGEQGPEFQQVQEMAICLSKPDGAEIGRIVSDALGNADFLRRFIEAYDPSHGLESGQKEQLRQQRCALNLLAALEDPTKGNRSLATFYLQIVAKSLKQFQSKPVKTALDRITSMIAENGAAQIVDSVVVLAELSGNAVVTLTEPVILRLASCVKDPSGQRVSVLAVIMEAAVRTKTPNKATKKLIRIAQKVVDESDGFCWTGLVPSLALLSHSDKGVRDRVVTLLSKILKNGGGGKLGNPEFADALALCETVTTQAPSMVQVGTSLTNFLARCMQQLDSDKARLAFMQLTIHAVFTAARRAPTAELGAFQSISWLAMGEHSGTRDAACTVLEAMEVTGEDAFSLSTRWKHLGTLLVDLLIDLEGRGGQSEQRIAGLAARQIKGVTVPGPQIVLSSGPDTAGSGRSRSYSVGNVEGVEVIRPYPQDMGEAIIRTIEATVFFRDCLVEAVLESTTWKSFVFPHLDSHWRRRIVKCLLEKGSESQTDSLLRSAMSLPLRPTDCLELLDQVPKKESAFSYLASLVDLVKVNATHLSGKKETDSLVASLFQTVQSLSKLDNSQEEDGVEFLIQSALRAVLDLLGEEPGDMPVDAIADWVDLILSLLGAPRDRSHAVLHHLKNWQGRSVCLAILTKIASLDCKVVVDSIVDMSLNMLPNNEAFNVDEVRSVLAVTVPLLWSNISSASRTMTSFLHDLLKMVLRQERAVCHLLLRDLVKGMIGAIGVDEKFRNLTPGIVSSVLIAMKDEVVSEDEWNQTVLTVFEASPVQAQVLSLSFLVEISRQVVGRLLGSPDTDFLSKYIPCCSDILRIARSSREEKESFERTKAFSFVAGALSLVSECIILDQVQKLLSKRSTNISTSSLKLWQNLLLIHATAESAMANTTEEGHADVVSWRTVAALAEECRGSVQANLPSSIFIAAVRSLLKENVAADLRSRSLRLASERVLDVDPQSQERAVFIEFLSDTIELIQNQTEDTRVRQGGLLYIEHATRTLLRPGSDEKLEKSAFQKLFRALGACSDSVNAVAGKKFDFSQLDVSTWHLLATFALTTTTIIGAIGIRALPKLGSLLKPFILAFAYANRKAEQDGPGGDGAIYPMVQIAVLRLILSITRTAPQAVFVHLSSLLNESGLFFEALRETGNPSIASSLQNVDDAFASKIPARLLIPALVKIISVGNQRPSTLKYVFDSLFKSLSELNASEGSLYRSLVTKATFKAFELECSEEGTSPLVDRAIRCIQGLVLKLSEVQFRKMYGDFCEWVKQDQEVRRYAFWSLSGALAKELKTIFLPCASLVMEEMVKDLNFYADSLSKDKKVEIIKDGRKKRKKSDGSKVDIGAAVLQALIPLLGTLSSILRADAQDGGKWTREHGRYHSLLEPLSTLLHCRISEALSPTIDKSPFEYVVEENPFGSVVGCLTSLALAAGDEQLWKPLNHAVLEACGHSSRGEVRKGGVVCLLSLIRTLGEEYMVLLPECLPVLAELLEDENEIISGLARDAVAQAEDLLGESLEANLR